MTLAAARRNAASLLSPSVLAIGRAVLQIGLVTVLVKGVSFGKEMAVAARFGVGREMDAFVLAFAATSFISGVFISAFPAAFVPAYHQARAERGVREAGLLPVEFLGLILVAMAGLTLLLAAGNGPILHLLAPGLAPPASRLLRLAFLGTLPLLVLQGISGVCGATLNAERHFLAPSVLPVLTPLAILASMALHRGGFQITDMVLALLAGGAFEAAALAWILKRTLPHVSFRFLLPRARVLRSFLAQYFPMVFGSIFMGSTLVVDMGFAGRLGPGEASALGYAARVPALIITLSSGSIATAVLPQFSRLVALEQFDEIWTTLRNVLLIAMLASLALVIALSLCSEPIIALLFRRGAFTPLQVRQVARIQTMYFLQIPFFIAGVFLARFIQAMKRNDLVLYGAILMAGLNLGLDLLLAPRMGSAGIALSTSLVYFASALFLGAAAWAILPPRASGAGAP